MSSSYLDKEISEWNSSDLSNWLIDNKYRGISELCQKYSLSGFDLFYITDEILRNDLGLNSFHERIVTQKLITKLTSEHLKLNIINSNGDNVILTLDNNPNMLLGDISKYIGNLFNIESDFILYKDSTKQEVLSPTIKIIQLMILYPRIYKTLNISNMKDYHQMNDKAINYENNEAVNSISKTGDTISHSIDKIEENEKIKNNYKVNIPTTPINNNITYSFGDNSPDLNSNSKSNNYNENNDNNYCENIPQQTYRNSSKITNNNQNNLILNKNDTFNDNNEKENQIPNKMIPSIFGKNNKYKSEKRIYREKEDLNCNYINMKNNPTEYIQNNEDRSNLGILTTSSNDENNEENLIKYNNRNYEETNNDNENDYSNNYQRGRNTTENNGYSRYKRINDFNKEYYQKNVYNDENSNTSNYNKMNKKRNSNNNKGFKEKFFNDNKFNDSNFNPNNY